MAVWLAKKALQILLVAAAVALLYLWGFRKMLTQTEDMTTMLRNKCAGILLKKLRKQGSLTEKEIENALKGVKAGQPWSRKRAVVQDAKTYGRQISDYLIENGLAEKDGSGLKLPVTE